MRYSEKDNFNRVIHWDTPSHVCCPSPSRGICYHGAWPGDIRPSPQCKEWQDIWGVTWIDVEGEVFPFGPAVASSSHIDELQAPDPHTAEIRQVLTKQYEKIDRNQFFVSVQHPYFLYEKGFNILGPEEFLFALAGDVTAAEQLLDKMIDFEIEIAKEYVRFKPDHVNTMDDYGMQHGMAISPDMWRKYFKPRLKRLYDFYRDELGPNVVISHHSCGHVMPILEDFINLGVKILNPLQSTANDVELAAEITKGRLVIAGAIDGQQILPFGSPDEVRQETFRKLDLFWDNGGYLPMPEKTLGVSEANKLAMQQAIQDWSKDHVESPISKAAKMVPASD